MRRGFSLVETVVTVGISAVALIALVNVFLTFDSVYGYQQASLATAGSAGTAMNALEAAILPAEQVLASRDFSGVVHSSSATTLVLQLPSVDSSGNIISGTKDYISFYPSGTTLYRLTLAGAGSVRASGLQRLSTTLLSVSFTYDDPDFTKVTNILADVRTQAQFKQQTVQGHLSERLFLRNL